MGENFKRFKARAQLIRVLKSLLVAISVGMLTYGALSLLIKFEVISLPEAALFGICGGALLVFGPGAFLLLRISDKKLAARLDSQFGLFERVETMLQYKDEHSAIYQLQRDDADAALSAIPTGKYKFRGLWIYLVCFALCAVPLFLSLGYTPKEEEPPVVEQIPFEITDMQIAAMEELISYVEESSMQSPYRESVAEMLKTLLSELSSVKVESEMIELLSGAMDFIYAKTDESSFALELVNELWLGGTSSSKKLAEALNYYNWPKADELDKFTACLEALRVTFVHADSLAESPDAEKMKAETEMLLIKIASNFENALLKSKMPEDDSLYKVLLRLAKAEENNDDGTRVYGLSTLARFISEKGYSDTQRELDATFTALGGEIFRSLEQHKTNTDVGEYTLKRLSEIFGCECPKFMRPELREETVDEPSAPGDDENEGGGGGAIGSGTVYGSDDLILDPYTNTYVEYGTILDKYYALMFGKLNDGKFTDEEKEALEKYFAILYGGFEEEGE